MSSSTIQTAITLAAALKNAADGPARYTSAQIASALRSPGVHPRLSASDLVGVLRAPSVFPALDRAEMAAALEAARVDAEAARQAMDDTFGVTYLRLVGARASSQIEAPYNNLPQTAERLVEGPNKANTFWNSAPDGSDPTPWFWVELERAAIVKELTIRWKFADGTTGARAMKFRVLSSTDGNSWDETGVDQSALRGLSPTQAVDVLPGWPRATRFIKVEMSESSYAGSNAYFTCHYVLVRGDVV